MIVIFFLGMVFLKDLCTPGSSMCLNNMLSICDENGHLVTTDCPEDTECNIKGEEMACVPNTKEKNKKHKNKDGDIMQQLLKLSKDKEFVNSLKKQLSKSEDDEEETFEEEEDDFEDPSTAFSDDEEEEEDLSDLIKKNKKDPDDDTHKLKKKPKKVSKNNDSTKKKQKPADKDKNNGESQPKKKKRNKVKVVHGNQNKNTKNDNPKVKTVTYHKVIENQKPAETVTVYKTIVQKDSESKIDIQVLPSGDKGIPPNVSGQNIYNGGTSPGDKQNGNGDGNYKQGDANHPQNGNGGSKPTQGGNGNGGSNPSQGGNGGGASKPTQGGNGGGASKPTQGGNGGSKPAQNGNGGSKPSQGGNGGGASKPSQGGNGGGASKPSQGGNGGSKPDQSGGGGASKPSQGGSNKPTGSQNGGGAKKDDKNPAADGDKKPAGKKDDNNSAADGDKKPKDSKSGGGGGGALGITSDQVFEAMKKENFNPKQEYVDPVVKITNEEFTDMNMAAMFLAQLAHESGGFEHIEEIDCAGSTKCADQYGGAEGAPGKSYHGRGFIQLSWPANYKAAGEALGMGDELFNNPDKIIEDPELGAKVSVWFWKENVENAPGVSENKFGATTKAINGALECTGSNVDQSKKRYAIYKTLAEVLGVTDLADESGCY